MPTYDYQCRSCGNTVEVIHSMKESGPTTCELCGGPLRTVLFPAGIIFKGAGFYKTDSRSSSSAHSGSKSGNGSRSTSEPGQTDGSSPPTVAADATRSGSSSADSSPSSTDSSGTGGSGSSKKAGASGEESRKGS